MTFLRTMILLGCGLLQAAPVDSHRREKGTPHNRITPIKVLLDRARTPFRLTSSDKQLYFRPIGTDEWTALGEKAFISPFKKTAIRLNTTLIRASAIEIRTKFQTAYLTYRKRGYRGKLILVRRKKSIWIINTLSVEEYLRGTLGSEMYSSWPLEALKAQAVASRTYAYFMQRFPKNPNYDLESTILDQVYKGTKNKASRVSLAVASTRHQYLSRTGVPIKAYFHSRCGGTTSPANYVWKGAEKYYRGVSCPFCSRKKAPWKAQMNFSDFLRKVEFPKTAGKPVVSLFAKEKGDRIKFIQIQSPKISRKLSADQLRKRIGYTLIKSANFSLSLEKEKLTFRGQGAGHGVGMCQWGAGDFARNGKSYEQILVHFYPLARLEIPSSPLL